MDVCLFWLLCFFRYSSLRRADHPSRGVLPTVVRRVCDLETSWMRTPSPTWGRCANIFSPFSVSLWGHSSC